jgi:hypothetical protein
VLGIIIIDDDGDSNDSDVGRVSCSIVSWFQFSGFLIESFYAVRALTGSYIQNYINS